VLDVLRHFLVKIHSELTPRGHRLANAFTQKSAGWYACSREHGDTAVRVSVEFVIGMSRGSARFHSTGGCTLGVKGKRGRAHRQTGGTGKMWPACEISVPTMYRRYKPGGGRGTGEGAGGGQRQRWRCPSATRLHIGELSAGPGPRDRCDAAIPRRRRRVRSPTNFPAWEGWGGVGKAGAGGGKARSRRARTGRKQRAKNYAKWRGKDGRGRWCEDRTIVCLLTAISSQ